MNFTRDLFYGNWSAPFGDVWSLQLALKELGYGNFTPTGFFGEKTQAAVSQFQKRNAITPNYGYFGPKTQPVLIKRLGECRKHRLQIFDTAISLLGTDVTPADIIPDEVDCANTVSVILEKARLPIGIFPLTTNMYKYLVNSPEWFKAYTPLEGDIIISPTGMGNGTLRNGHVGIMGKGTQIMSNSSLDGIFKQNFTISTWEDRYSRIGGFPVLYFRRA